MGKGSSRLAFYLAILAVLAAPTRGVVANPTSFRLKSSAFGDGQSIPKKYTCEGEGLSPELSWEQPPEGTQGFALVVEDPDAPAGTWVHWVLYYIPGDRRSFPEGVPKGGRVPGGGLQGKNSWGFQGYGGPCPPPGKKHHYLFRLYALSKILNLKTGMTRDELLPSLQGAVLGEAQWSGTFGR